jgi:hypothetical protein
MASGFNISTFKTRGLVYGGTRPTLFEVYLTPPTGIGADQDSHDKFRFTCRAASLPAATIQSIDVGYFGRKIKVQGDRTFADWQVTVMNDEDFLVRSMFEKWSNALNRMESNIRDPNFSTDENSYKVDMDVLQYGKDGSLIRQYTIIGGFPTDVSEIALDWDTTNQIETFTVRFAYDYWLPAVEEVNAYLSDAVNPTST